MKRCIVVYGNMASGKSTFCQVLAEKGLKTYTHICLDDFRLQVAHEHPKKPKVESEELAQSLCLTALESTENVIFETTACSRFWEQVYVELFLQRIPTFFIHIDCPLHVCLQRFYYREAQGHYSIRPPYQTNDPYQTLVWIASHTKMVRKDLVFSSAILSKEEMISLFLEKKPTLKLKKVT